MNDQAARTERLFWAPEASEAGAVRRALGACGLRRRRSKGATLRDAYLDTDDWWLYRAGAACRLRQAGGGTSLTLELLCPTDEIPLDGRPLREELDGGSPDLPGPLPGRRLVEWLGPLMDGAAVDARLRLTRERALFGASGPVDVALDGVRVEADGEPQAFVEVRLSAPRDAADALGDLAARLRDECGLEPADAHLLVRGLKLAGVTPPALAEGEELTVRAHDRFIEAAHRILKRQFRRMLWNEPGTRLGLDAEYLHDMRVATRRMRAALRAFRNAMPREQVDALRSELKWLADALGRVRDLDVYLLDLEEEVQELDPEIRPAMEPYVDHLRQERVAARRAMLRALETKRYGKLVRRFERLFAAGPPEDPSRPKAARPVTEEARSLIRKRLKRVLRDGRDVGPKSPDGDLHKLRIRCKRLRYACEFFADLYGSAAHKFARRVKKLQDRLGENQDSVVARQKLSEFARDAAAGPEGTERLDRALGRLMARHAKRGKKARDGFFRAWKKFDRKKTRRPLEGKLDRLAGG